MAAYGRKHAHAIMPESGHTVWYAVAGGARDFGLFRNLHRVIDFDAEVANRTFQFDMTNQ